MSIISRITTWTVGQILKAADLNGEFNNIVNLFNNLDGGTTTWTNVNATTSVITTLTPTTLTHGGMKYRRPVLQYSSGTVVNLETGLNGTSGAATVMFPDGSVRSDSTSGRINCNLAQNAVLSGSAQSGLRTGSQSANTWYSFYAVKTTDNTSNFVLVADTVVPIQANFATLNSNFGTNGWVYLGVLPNGDNAGATNVILKFYMAGNRTWLANACAGNASIATGSGIRLADTNSATTLAFTYSAGVNISTPQVPQQITHAMYVLAHQNGANTEQILNSGGNYNLFSYQASTGTYGMINIEHAVQEGIKINSGGAEAHDIFLRGYVDGILGVGENPLL